MDELQTKLRQLQDIQALVASGDNVLARELFRTVQSTACTTTTTSPSAGARLLQPTPQDGWARLTMSAMNATSPARKGPLSGTLMSSSSLVRTPQPSRKPPVRIEPLTKSAEKPLSGNINNSESMSKSAEYNNTSSLHHSGGDFKGKHHEPPHGVAYPHNLILRLTTVHNVDPQTRSSIGDLDEAIMIADEDVRNLHREIRRRHVEFENLAPGEGYLRRDRMPLSEVLEQEERECSNEVAVIREQIAAAFAERAAAQRRVELLTDKLRVLKQHVDAVHEAVSADRQMRRETYPALSDTELFATASTSLEIRKMIDAKRHLIKENKQYLYRLRIKNEHSLASAARQVAKKRKELNRLRHQTTEGLRRQVETEELSSVPPSSILLSPFGGAADDAASTSVATVDGSSGEAEASATTSARLLPKVSFVASPEGTAKRSHHEAHVSSVELLASLPKRAPPLSNGSKQPPVLALKDGPLLKALMDGERAARKQAEVIYADSTEVLFSKMRLHKLQLQDAEAKRRSPPRSVSRTRLPPPRQLRIRQQSGETATVVDHVHDASVVVSQQESPQRDPAASSLITADHFDNSVLEKIEERTHEDSSLYVALPSPSKTVLVDGDNLDNAQEYEKQVLESPAEANAAEAQGSSAAREDPAVHNDEESDKVEDKSQIESPSSSSNDDDDEHARSITGEQQAPPTSTCDATTVKIIAEEPATVMVEEMKLATDDATLNDDIDDANEKVYASVHAEVDAGEAVSTSTTETKTAKRDTDDDDEEESTKDEDYSDESTPSESNDDHDEHAQSSEPSVAAERSNGELSADVMARKRVDPPLEEGRNDADESGNVASQPEEDGNDSSESPEDATNKAEDDNDNNDADKSSADGDDDAPASEKDDMVPSESQPQESTIEQEAEPSVPIASNQPSSAEYSERDEPIAQTTSAE